MCASPETRTRGRSLYMRVHQARSRGIFLSRQAPLGWRGLHARRQWRYRVYTSILDSQAPAGMASGVMPIIASVRRICRRA